MWRYKFCITILLGLLVFSIVLNFSAYRKIKEIYSREQKLHLKPINKSVNNYVENNSDDNSFSVILLGDSRIKEWWPKPNIEEVNIINYGIGGETTEQLLNRIENDIGLFKGKFIILQIGINDLKTIGVLEEEKEDIIDNCFENIYEILKLLTLENNRVILLTIFPTGKVPFLRRFFWDDSIPLSVKEVNEKLKDISLPNVLTVDCDAMLIGQNNLIRPEFSKDELHLNEKGYEELNHILDPIVTALLSSHKTK